VVERLRFHFDENCHPAIARALRRHGVDVTTTTEAGLRTQSDAAQVAFARQERRVIVTGDTDFLRLAQQGVEHQGIIFYPPHRTIGEVVRHLVLIYELFTPEEMSGCVEFI
jgi:uncharacterized protein with PIN domain